MAELNGVIFDMDGLIFDTELLYYQATQIIADQMGIPYTKEDYLAYVGVSDEEVWAAYHEWYDEDFGAETVERFIQSAFDQTVLLFEQGGAALKPGVIELLRYLDQKGIPRVLASSNQRKVIDILLDSAELTEEFPQIVCFDDVARAKPDPEIFEKAQQLLGLPKSQLVILEDSANGIHAAHAAGIPVIMIPDLIAPTSIIEEKVKKVLPALTEIPDYFEQIYTW
jgi:HAD superfamily hydrolase (TIGR01509 family)